MPISEMAPVFRRLIVVPAAYLGLSVALAACASWPWQSDADPRTAAATEKPAAPACPNAKARHLTCVNGVKMVSYEASFDLPRYCDPLQQLETKVRGFDRNQPLHKLANGERVMLVGAAGWLVLPRESGILDVPESTTAWWNNRACTLPSALR
jgi:hypothetical protein